MLNHVRFLEQITNIHDSHHQWILGRASIPATFGFSTHMKPCVFAWREDNGVVILNRAKTNFVACLDVHGVMILLLRGRGNHSTSAQQFSYYPSKHGNYHSPTSLRKGFTRYTYYNLSWSGNDESQSCGSDAPNSRATS